MFMYYVTCKHKNNTNNSNYNNNNKLFIEFIIKLEFKETLNLTYAIV